MDVAENEFDGSDLVVWEELTSDNFISKIGNFAYYKKIL